MPGYEGLQGRTQHFQAGPQAHLLERHDEFVHPRLAQPLDQQRPQRDLAALAVCEAFLKALHGDGELCGTGEGAARGRGWWVRERPVGGGIQEGQWVCG